MKAPQLLLLLSVLRAIFPLRLTNRKESIDGDTMHFNRHPCAMTRAAAITVNNFEAYPRVVEKAVQSGVYLATL